MVAKSYQSMEQVCDPFMENGRMYVNVKNAKTGTIRKVRWYSSAEYAKMYGEKVSEPTSSVFASQKKLLGFENGYITIFKGDTYANLEWFQRSIARYCKWWGWYIVSTETVPIDLPADIEPIKLAWELVGNEDGELKSDDQIKSAVESILYDATNSVFVGEIGDRLDRNIEVIAAYEKESYYGRQTIHYMLDECGNQFLWATSAKSWKAGDKFHIRGTVKDHKVIRNVETTVLTRCSVV